MDSSNSENSVLAIRDGLYLGDTYAVKNLNLIVKYKIFHIVNCAAGQIQNQFAEIGVKYLDFYWKDEEYEVILDDDDKNLSQVENFINNARLKQENILVASMNGKCRSCAIMIAYLMKKWALFEAIQFIGSRKPELQLRKCFLEQLTALEKRLFPVERPTRQIKWIEENAVPKKPPPMGLLRPHSLEKTFANSFFSDNDDKQKERVRFNDSEILFPTTTYSNNFKEEEATPPKQARSILKKRDQSPDSDSRSNLHTPASETDTKGSEKRSKEKVTPSRDSSPPSKEQESIARPYSGISKPFRPDTKVTLQPTSYRTTFAGLRATGAEEQPASKNNYFVPDDRTVIPELTTFNSMIKKPVTPNPKTTNRAPSISTTDSSSNVYSQIIDKNFFAQVEYRENTPKFSSRKASADAVETFYGRSFLKTNTRQYEKQANIQPQQNLPVFNTKLTQNYSNLYNDSFLPGLYEKYRARPSDLETDKEKNHTYKDVRSPELDSNRLSNSFHTIREPDYRNKDTSQNQSVIEYRNNNSDEGSPTTRDPLKTREYSSETGSQYAGNANISRLLIRERIKPELDRLANDKRDILKNGIYNTQVNKLSPARIGSNAERAHGRSSSVPTRNRDDLIINNDPRSQHERGPLQFLKQTGLTDEEYRQRLEPRPKSRNEFQTTFLKQNLGNPNLQMTTSKNANIFNTTATNLMKSKYGPFELGQTKSKNLYKPATESPKAANHNSSRYWTIFEDSNNLYYPVNPPMQQRSPKVGSPRHEVDNSSRSNSINSKPNRLNPNPTPLRQKYNELQYINRVFKKEDPRVPNTSQRPRFESRDQLDYNMLVSTIYKDKKFSGLVLE